VQEKCPEQEHYLPSTSATGDESRPSAGACRLRICCCCVPPARQLARQPRSPDPSAPARAALAWRSGGICVTYPGRYQCVSQPSAVTNRYASVTRALRPFRPTLQPCALAQLADGCVTAGNAAARTGWSLLCLLRIRRAALDHPLGAHDDPCGPGSGSRGPVRVAQGQPARSESRSRPLRKAPGTAGITASCDMCVTDSESTWHVRDSTCHMRAL
jgi:hypothetical protein